MPRTPITTSYGTRTQPTTSYNARDEVTTTYWTRTSPTTDYNSRIFPWFNCMNVIITGIWDDTQVWEDDKYWWDDGAKGTWYGIRTIPTTTYT